MTRETAYLACRLRLARFDDGEEGVRHISLVSPEVRERIVFASLPELFQFLEAKSGKRHRPTCPDLAGSSP